MIAQFGFLGFDINAIEAHRHHLLGVFPTTVSSSFIPSPPKLFLAAITSWPWIDCKVNKGGKVELCIVLFVGPTSILNILLYLALLEIHENAG